MRDEGPKPSTGGSGKPAEKKDGAQKLVAKAGDAAKKAAPAKPEEKKK